LEKGIRRFVHLSTTEVYGNVTGEIDETSPLSYTGNDYNRIKIDAEKACWEYAKKGLPLIVIRPSIVYGPFSKNWSVRFAIMFTTGKWSIYENYGEGKCNLVYIDDLFEAILKTLDHEKAVGNAFNICGPEVITWNEYFRKYNAKMGLPPLKTINAGQANLRSAMMQPVRSIGGIVRDHFLGPAKKLAETFEFVDRLMRQTEHAVKSTPSPDELKLFNKAAVFSCKKAMELLEFKPAISVDEGLERTQAWLRHQGFY
jgi:nucleoside-diphosphate-sugar epimerase